MKRAPTGLPGLPLQRQAPHGNLMESVSHDCSLIPTLDFSVSRTARVHRKMLRMGERELRAKYGGKLDKAINRAIRAEMPSGNAALDTLARLSGPAASSGWTDSVGSPTAEAAAFYKHQRSVVGPLVAKVRRKYEIKDVPAAKAAKSPAAKGRPQARPRFETGPRERSPQSRATKDRGPQDRGPQVHGSQDRRPRSGGNARRSGGSR